MNEASMAYVGKNAKIWGKVKQMKSYHRIYPFIIHNKGDKKMKMKSK